MNASRLLLLALGACSAPAAPTWNGETGSAAPAFSQDGPVWRATVPARGLSGSFSAGEARITTHAGELRLWTLGVGRGAALAEPDLAVPTLSDCAGGDAASPCPARIVARGPGLEEWWSADDRGLEQGWRVDAAPPGIGPLRVALGLDGALAERTASGARLRMPGGGGLRVTGLRASDARGAELPARITPTTAGFDIQVDDAGARYPLSIDPLYSTAIWEVVGTTTSEASYGKGVAGRGDVNGDGYPDVLVGAPGYEAVGAVFVYLGAAGGLDLAPAATLTGDEVDAQFGSNVQIVGDVDGDGYDDVAVSAEDETVGGVAEAGEILIYMGSADGLDSAPTQTLEGSCAKCSLGHRLSPAGDVNGDGYADLAVSSAVSDGATPYVWVYYGSASGFPAAPDFTYGVPSTPKKDYGSSISGVGDVNGDGYDDLAVGNPSSSTSGEIVVLLGSDAGLDSASAFTVTASVKLGLQVSGAGDVNGDGYDDVIAGLRDSMEAWLYLGSASGLTIAATLEDSYGDSIGKRELYYGQRVRGAGDLDGDGYDDVLVNSYLSTYCEVVYAYRGGPSGLDTMPSAIVVPECHDSSLEWGLAPVGDVDGDGRDDVVIGDAVVDDGAAQLYPGGDDLLDADTAQELERPLTRAGTGLWVVPAGDVNGDGHADLLVPAIEVARAFLYLGSATGFSATPDFSVVAEDGYDGEYLPSGVGDVDGDGYDDVVVPFYAESYTDPDEISLYQGSASGLSDTPAVTWEGGGWNYNVGGAGDSNGDGYDDVVEMKGDQFYWIPGSASGLDVSSRTKVTYAGTDQEAYLAGCTGYFPMGAGGDVDGDGYDDIVVGYPAAGDEDETHWVGWSPFIEVFYGSSAGLTKTGADTIKKVSRTSEGDAFGCSVSIAGDLDGDGYDDVAVTEYKQNRVWVYYGSPTGISSSDATEIDAPSDSSGFAVQVSGAGDVDGDGYADLVVGQSGGSTGAPSNSGSVWLYLGASGGIGTVPVMEIQGIEEGQHLGSSLAAVGDVDGDGFPDLVVGSSGSKTLEGRIELYLGYRDADGDGFSSIVDCDDTDASVIPDTVYTDADGDGYGDPGTEALSCSPSAGEVLDDTDCDDSDAAVSPAGVEVCDDGSVDEDCDGLIDDADPSVSSAPAWYADNDGDGLGDAAAATTACVAPEGSVADATDCDDTDPTVLGPSTWYTDADDDGWGDEADSLSACDAPTGTAAEAGDCDDADASVHPGAIEILGDGVDQDCDGVSEGDSGGEDTGSPETGSPETGSPETGSPETGSPETGSPESGSPESGSPETGGVGDDSVESPSAEDSAPDGGGGCASDKPGAATCASGGGRSGLLPLLLAGLSLLRRRTGSRRRSQPPQSTVRTY